MQPIKSDPYVSISSIAVRSDNRCDFFFQNSIFSSENANRQYGEQLMTIDQAASLGIDKNNDIYFEVNDYKANTQVQHKVK